jgi:hypothetical protein
VETVVISLGGGRTSVVETGTISVAGISVVELEVIISVGASAARLGGEASGEGLLGEQADRIRVKKRKIPKILCIGD